MREPSLRGYAYVAGHHWLTSRGGSDVFEDFPTCFPPSSDFVSRVHQNTYLCALHDDARSLICLTAFSLVVAVVVVGGGGCCRRRRVCEGRPEEVDVLGIASTATLSEQEQAGEKTVMMMVRLQRRPTPAVPIE
jgi:hypothetical protein